MKGVFQRRQLFVHPIQYWFVTTTLLYFACLLLTLYAVVFLPMAQPLYDRLFPGNNVQKLRRSFSS
jgi:hypothetical protein